MLSKKLWNRLSSLGFSNQKLANQCTGALQHQWRQNRCFGQPASQTHPHLLQHGEVTPGVTKEEYQERRARLMERILSSRKNFASSDHIVIIPSATKVFMTHDIPYTFRQQTDFLYLSGFQEPDSFLILESSSPESSSNHRSTLFVPRKDAHKELWEGPRSGASGTIELTGIDHAYNSDELPTYLSCYLKDHRGFVTWYDYQKPAQVDFHVNQMRFFLKEASIRPGMLENPRKIIQSLRVIKSPSEIALMQRSCDIASKGFREVMRYSHPQVNEGHLCAKMDFECRVKGAEYLAYPPVVAGGNRANTIHYVANNQMVEDGDLVLMDAGCEYHGYASDITRTWPVSGHFNPAQSALYEAVLQVQRSCIILCQQHDMTMDQLFREMLTLIGLQLRRLGIMPKKAGPTDLQIAAREFCPHHVGHFLGMDVHDTDEISRSVSLQPGMVVTVEPGVYIPTTRVDVPVEFQGLGIRIEDDVLITETGCEVLTKACPKDLQEVKETVQGLR